MWVSACEMTNSLDQVELSVILSHLFILPGQLLPRRFVHVRRPPIRACFSSTARVHVHPYGDDAYVQLFVLSRCHPLHDFLGGDHGVASDVAAPLSGQMSRGGQNV